MVRAAGIAAGALFLAIGLAAQFGGADVFGTPSYGHTEALAPALKPASPSPSPSAKPSPSPVLASPVALAVTAGGTIYTAVPSSGGGGGGHKKKKGG